ncbi:MAG: hypothetical protein B6D45_09650, partial [Ignavibacteriales bacterium UTCHB3]
MDKVTPNGIHFQNFGSGEQAVVFIHGFIFDSELWLRQIPPLEDKYRVVVPDLRGFGASTDCDGMVTLESYADDILELVKELKLEKPVLAGLSMGGYVTLRVAEREPNLFRGLMLFDTRATADSNEAKIKRAAGIRIIKGGGLRTYTAALMDSIFYDTFK